jgi:DnaJ-class molecular chaperone
MKPVKCPNCNGWGDVADRSWYKFGLPQRVICEFCQGHGTVTERQRVQYIASTANYDYKHQNDPR